MCVCVCVCVVAGSEPSINTEHTPCGHEVCDRAVNKHCLVRGTGAVLGTG